MSVQESITTKLNTETSKIGWSELQKAYAQGLVIAVDLSLDLIKTAVEFSHDNKVQVEQWLAAGSIVKVEDKQAQKWHDSNAVLWAVVVAPWVLVQETAPEQ